MPYKQLSSTNNAYWQTCFRVQDDLQSFTAIGEGTPMALAIVNGRIVFADHHDLQRDIADFRPIGLQLPEWRTA